jgi:putative endonuclease
VPKGPAANRGEEAEQAALHYLEKQGLSLITRNYRCRQGEIDLIMTDGNQLAFIEVRYRKNSLFGSAAESVTTSKQRRIAAAASHYLISHGDNRSCRFDVVAIAGDHRNGIEWIQNAFQTET